MQVPNWVIITLALTVASWAFQGPIERQKEARLAREAQVEQQINDEVDSFVGKGTTALYDTWGLPKEVIANPDSGSVLVYYRYYSEFEPIRTYRFEVYTNRDGTILQIKGYTNH
jgi:hypothetical protein